MKTVRAEKVAHFSSHYTAFCHLSPFIFFCPPKWFCAKIKVLLSKCCAQPPPAVDRSMNERLQCTVERRATSTDHHRSSSSSSSASSDADPVTANANSNEPKSINRSVTDRNIPPLPPATTTSCPEKGEPHQRQCDRQVVLGRIFVHRSEARSEQIKQKTSTTTTTTTAATRGFPFPPSAP